MPFDLPPGRVHVRYAPLAGEVPAAQIASWLDLLDGDERQRCQRFRFARHRHLFAAAHALLRRTLADVTGVAPDRLELVAGPHGKPRLACQPSVPVEFNLTHTEGLVACAITRRHAVGVDAEPRDRDVRMEIAERFFSPAENEHLRALADASARRQALVDLWTLKEAVVKAMGRGLSVPLRAFTVGLGDPPSVAFHAPLDTEDPRSWQLFRVPHATHRIAVALRNPTGQAAHVLAEPVPLGAEL
jgi:4'-phosphopantetheinyl transferase